MPAFFLTLVAAALATLAGREAVRVARLADALGARVGLLLALWLAAVGSAACAGWLSAVLARELSATAKALLVAIVLLVAAGELVLLRPAPAPREPTRSLAAIVVVLLAGQLSGAAWLLVLALAAATPSPQLAALGGALGSGLLLTASWSAGAEWEARLPLRVVRWAVAGAMLLAAAVVALTARGALG